MFVHCLFFSFRTRPLSQDFRGFDIDDIEESKRHLPDDIKIDESDDDADDDNDDAEAPRKEVEPCDEPQIEQLESQELAATEQPATETDSTTVPQDKSVELEVSSCTNLNDEKRAIVEGILEKVVDEITQIGENENITEIVGKNQIPKSVGNRITYCRFCCSQDRAETKQSQRLRSNAVNVQPNALKYRKMTQKRNSSYPIHKK